MLGRGAISSNCNLALNIDLHDLCRSLYGPRGRHKVGGLKAAPPLGRGRVERLDVGGDADAAGGVMLEKNGTLPGQPTALVLLSPPSSSISSIIALSAAARVSRPLPRLSSPTAHPVLRVIPSRTGGLEERLHRTDEHGEAILIPEMIKRPLGTGLLRSESPSICSCWAAINSHWRSPRPGYERTAGGGSFDVGQLPKAGTF